MARHEEAHKEHINKYKMAHSIGVAEYMRENAEKYGLDGDEMYVAGLLHDIGYLHGRENHEEAGLEILKKVGINEKIAFAISNHGESLYKVEAREQNKLEFWASYSLLKEHPEIVLMCEADMSVNAQGYRVGFDKRLEDIGERYGYKGIEYQTAADTVDFVKDCLKKIERIAVVEHAKTEEETAEEEYTETEPKKLTVEIYQINTDLEEGKKLIFLGSDKLAEKGIKIEAKNYNCIYKYEVESFGDDPERTEILENVYTKFNTTKPKDYGNHPSVSMSDVIVLNDGKQSEAYYVERFGFTKVNDWNSREARDLFANKTKAHEKTTVERD